MIRSAQPQDISEVVRIHLESFPNFFLSFLGPMFLRLLYEEILSSPEGVLLVAEEGRRDLIGFVAGVTRQSGFYSRLVRHRKWGFAIAASPAVLRRPSIAARLVRALKRPHDASNVEEACLMSIAVKPVRSGRGTGSQLVSSFSREMRARAIDRYCLTTDRDGNDGVNSFYRTLGFQLARTFVTAEGRRMNEYAISTDTEIR